jgi:hypothetical protein
VRASVRESPHSAMVGIQREENRPSVEFSVFLTVNGQAHEYKANLFNELMLAEREGFGLSATL